MKDAFRELHPIAAEWEIIGLLLEIPHHVLKAIEIDIKDIHDCLQAMLVQWLKQSDPPPTWKNLADAVEEINESIAEKIRTKYLVTI